MPSLCLMQFIWGAFRWLTSQFLHMKNANWEFHMGDRQVWLTQIEEIVTTGNSDDKKNKALEILGVKTYQSSIEPYCDLPLQITNTKSLTIRFEINQSSRRNQEGIEKGNRVLLLWFQWKGVPVKEINKNGRSTIIKTITSPVSCRL